MNAAEFEDVKVYAKIAKQSQSKFIRSAIRMKIAIIKNQEHCEQGLLPFSESKSQDHDLKLQELKIISKILKKFEKK